jgi:hypothetical protein
MGMPANGPGGRWRADFIRFELIREERSREERGREEGGAFGSAVNALFGCANHKSRKEKGGAK